MVRLVPIELANSGVTVWYGKSDAPAPPEQVSNDSPLCVTVGVRPAHPANGLDVAYRVNQGPDLEMQATLSRTDYSKNQQFFCAEFPPFSPGTRVEYAPVVRQAGRRIDFRQNGQYPSSFYVTKSDKQTQLPRPSTGAPVLHPYHLEHLTQGDLTIKGTEVIGETPEGIRLVSLISGGTYRGKINGYATPTGGDWLTIRPDGIGLLDAKVTLMTDDGASILMVGSGTLDLGRDGYRNVLAGHYPPKAPIVEFMRFLSSDPKYAWLVRMQCVGIGYASTEKVCYDIYAVHSLCT